MLTRAKRVSEGRFRGRLLHESHLDPVVVGRLWAHRDGLVKGNVPAMASVVPQQSPSIVDVAALVKALHVEREWLAWGVERKPKAASPRLSGAKPSRKASATH